MNAIVIEHVPVADLPAAWRERLAPSAGATVTVRIEREPQPLDATEAFRTDDPAFGIWSHGLQMADALVAATGLEHGLVLLTGKVKQVVSIDGLLIERFSP